MISIERAEKVATAWLTAWNAHDLDAILDHYADPLEFTSPLVVERLGRADGTIRAKVDLRAYFAMGLNPGGLNPGGLTAGSNLKFDLIEVLSGVSSLTIYYRNHRQRSVAEVLFLDDRDKVTKAVVHYR